MQNPSGDSAPSDAADSRCLKRDIHHFLSPTLMLFQSIVDVEIVAASFGQTQKQTLIANLGDGSDVLQPNDSLCHLLIQKREALVINDLDQATEIEGLGLSERLRAVSYVGVPVFSDSGELIGTLFGYAKHRIFLHDQALSQLNLLASQLRGFLEDQRNAALRQQEWKMLTASKARYASILNQAAAGIISINERGIIQSTNPYFKQLLGYSEDELVGLNVSCLMPGHHAQEHDSYLATYLNGRSPSIIGKGRKVSAVHKDGHWVPVHLAVNEVIHGDSKEFIGILSDLSELAQAEEDLRAERNLLKSIIDAHGNPLYVSNLEGDYTLANQACLDAANIFDRSSLGDTLSHLVEPPVVDRLLAINQRVLATGNSESINVTLHDGRTFQINKTCLNDIRGERLGVVNLAHDITTLLNAKEQAESQKKLIEVLHRGLTDYKALMSGNSLWSFLREALKELTESDYALIGEVVNVKGKASLKVHLITDLSWDEGSRKLMNMLRQGDMLLDNPNTTLGQVFAAGNVVISNDFQSDPRRGGALEGHPKLTNYLGVPIVDEGKVIGMYAIANSHRELTDQLVDWLKPFTATCSLLIKLYRQMSEREQFTNEIKQARDQAEQASRAKNEFLSSMSHELRTPLNSILGFAQLLVSGRKAPLPEQQRNQVEQIYKSGKHLLTLINDVLDLAKIESGKIHLSLESLLLQDAVKEALDSMESIAQEQRITLQDLIKPLPSVHVIADYTRLKQVLINLLSNAIKYNYRHGRVTLSCEILADQRIAIHVADTGMGIAKEKQRNLFQPFNRLGAENTMIEGTGVGLSLTKKLIEQMNGSIDVKSEEGHGSVFSVLLPTNDQSDEQVPSQSDIGRPVASDKDRKHCSTILYIEDNPTNQRLMADIFEDLENVELICTHDAYLGIEIARQKSLAMIIMDINLPGLDGYQAQKIIAKDDKLRTIPIIALSANAMEKDIEKGRKAGFADYLTKPIDILELKRTVSHYLNNGEKE